MFVKLAGGRRAQGVVGQFFSFRGHPMKICPLALRRGAGFSLVELLVVIAIISLLVALLLPALSGSRILARQNKELIAGKQHLDDLAMYTLTYKDRFVPAGPAWSWVHPGSAPPGILLRPSDPFPTMGAATLWMEGSIGKSWVWHMASALGTRPNHIQFDPATYQNFMSRGQSGIGAANGWIQHADNTAQGAFAAHPSFGMNGLYIGGHSRFNGNFGGPNGQEIQARPKYIRSVYQAHTPSFLIYSASARGGDVSGTGFWGYYAAAPNSGIIRPGNHLITAPIGQTWGPWLASNRFDRIELPTAWGCIDFRHRTTVNRNAVVNYLDGHADISDAAGLRDMRKWNNRATNPTMH